MPNLGTRCTATCWKGDPNDKMAAKARCKWMTGHPSDKHLDENGNWFTGTGADSKVCVLGKLRAE